MTIPLTELRSEDAAPVRPVRLGPREAMFDRRPDGTIYIRSPHPLAPYPVKLTERLEYWAKTAPDRTFMAQRDAGGGWRRLSYAQTLDSVRRIGTALLTRRDLTPERPVVILSGNDLEHALLGLAAMYVGIPYAPISPPYSLISSDFGKLKQILALLTPGLDLRGGRHRVRTRHRAGGAARRRGGGDAQSPGRRGRRRCSPNCSPPRPIRPPMRRTPRSGRTPSPKSSSPRARPASRRASSTPSACGARTR